MTVLAKLMFGAVFFFSVSVASAQNVDGVLRVVKGDVQIKSAKSGQTAKARIGEKVYPKDVVITGKDSRAKIVMVDQNEINVSPESQIEIQHYEYDPAAGKKEVLLNVIYGKVRAKVEQKYDGKTSKFNVKTPSAVAGVRGTDFLTSYNRVDKSSQVITFHGAVQFGVPGPNGGIMNAVSVTPGTTATASAGAPPTPPTQVSKTELAKVDSDTKAETGAAPKSDRTPSNDNGGGTDKKEGDKSGEKSGDAKPGDKSAAGEKKDGNANGGDKSTAAAGGDKPAAGGDKPAASGEKSASSDRSPASAPAPTTPAPTKDVGFDASKDSAACTTCNPPPVAPPPAPPAAPRAPVITQPNQCATCNSLIQGGNTKVNVQIK